MHLRKLLPGIEDGRFYYPVRDLYLRIVKRSYWKNHVLGQRRFYKQFITPGALVFDVGANNGEYSRTFLSLGARVVAIEPTPKLVKRLRNIRRLTVESCAVGNKPGTMPLYVSEASHMNSLVPDWLALAAPDRQFESFIDVEVSTLDRLIQKHGMPSFIKIDVEGYEDFVLQGLSSKPHWLSFEFHAETKDQAIACVRRFPDAKFNYLIGEEPEPLGKWTEIGGIVNMIGNLPDRCYGDIFVMNA